MPLNDFLKKLRQDHPHLPIIINEDALSSNAPHIREAQKHNLRFLLGVKEGDHAFLFEQVRIAEKEDRTITFEIVDQNNPKMIHRFRFLNHVPLNASNQDLLVNFLEYWEITPNKTKTFQLDYRFL
jgi:hypothetical protein